MPNPDLILHGGRIYPRVDRPASFQAIAIWNGQVADIGSDKRILGTKGRSADTIDLRGLTVIPGLSDSHIHLLGYGMLLRSLDLGHARSISEITRAVEAASRKARGNGWIVGRGWDQEKLRERRYPIRNDFSRVTRPVFLRRVCGHVAVANAEALSRAGVTKATIPPSGGVIEHDSLTGEPTGVLKEKALNLVMEAIPLREDEVEEALSVAARRLLRVGLTSLHCIVENLLELRALRRLKRLAQIRQSIYAILPLGLLDRALAMGLATEGGPGDFRIGGVKVYLDGSLGARTAALSEPYSDEASTGLLTMERAILDNVAEKAAGSGFQLSLHAIGDRAVKEGIAVIEGIQPGGKGRDLRHRIEHSSLTPPTLISRLRRNRIVVSVQPSFISSDSWAEKRLGPRRVRYLYPFRSMLKAGIQMAAGSDCPVENPNPFLGVWAAVARPGLAAAEGLEVGDALACYTTGSAYASFSEEFRGMLLPGMIADMLVLDRDPFKCPVDELREVKVLETIIAGKRVFLRSSWRVGRAINL